MCELCQSRDPDTCDFQFTDKVFIRPFFLKENNEHNHSSCARGDGGVSPLQTLCKNEFLNKYGILQTDFTHYASFLLNFCAGGDPSSCTMPDNVKFNLSTCVQFLQLQVEKITHAAISELTISKIAHEAEMAKLRIKFDEEMNEVNIISKENLSLDAQNGDLIAKKVEYLEMELRHSQEATKSSDQEVQHLKSSNEEKEKALKELKSETSQLKALLAEIEKKAAIESVTSGSYADDHANPSMLEDACRSVDKATDILIRVLHGVSITSNSAKQKDRLEHFLYEISFATQDNFSRKIQLKYAWGHWICSQIFDDFEHVFFDVDEGSKTSPLDPKNHAEKCFQSYQKKKHMPSVGLYEGCDMFRAFCDHKYSSVFPFDLVQKAFYPSCNSNERFSCEDEIYRLFLDVAKAVWLLHELSFSFDPPATILRMAFEFPFDMQYHESVIHDEDNSGKPRDVLLMIRPAFRLRNSIVRSRVFVKTSNN